MPDMSIEYIVHICSVCLPLYSFQIFFESHINIYENETPKTKRTMYFVTISADICMELNLDR